MFVLLLEQFEPVKYSRVAVGSFRNRVYRKSKKISPKSDLNQRLRLYLVTFLKDCCVICVKNSIQKTGSKNRTTPKRDPSQKRGRRMGRRKVRTALLVASVRWAAIANSPSPQPILSHTNNKNKGTC